MTPAPSKVTRDQIVEAAIEVLDEHGSDGFSIRRLGDDLGVAPVAVYHHVATKAVLLDLVVDEVWARVAPLVDETGSDDDWRVVAARPVRALRRVLLDHPKIVPVVATRPATTPRMLAMLDHHLGRLAAAGLSPAHAMPLLDCLVAFTVGTVRAEVREPVGGPGVPPEEVWAALTPQSHPNLAAALGGGYDWAPEAQFETGLAALLGGWPDPADPGDGRVG